MSRSNFVPGTFLPNDGRDINKLRSMIERANWRTRTRRTGDVESMCSGEIIKETEIYGGLGGNKCQTTMEADLPQPGQDISHQYKAKQVSRHGCIAAPA